MEDSNKNNSLAISEPFVYPISMLSAQKMRCSFSLASAIHFLNINNFVFRMFKKLINQITNKKSFNIIDRKKYAIIQNLFK